MVVLVVSAAVVLAAAVVVRGRSISVPPIFAGDQLLMVKTSSD